MVLWSSSLRSPLRNSTLRWWTCDHLVQVSNLYTWPPCPARFIIYKSDHLVQGFFTRDHLVTVSIYTRDHLVKGYIYTRDPFVQVSNLFYKLDCTLLFQGFFSYLDIVETTKPWNGINGRFFLLTFSFVSYVAM